MDDLKLLGVALGLACLAGLNLYLTVFVTGLAIHQHWIILSPAYQSLAVLGDPLILWISGTLYFWVLRMRSVDRLSLGHRPYDYPPDRRRAARDSRSGAAEPSL